MIDQMVQLVLDALMKLRDESGPILVEIAEIFEEMADRMDEAIEKIEKQIKKLIKKLEDLKDAAEAAADAMADAGLVAHSPSAMELALMGINREMGRLNQLMGFMSIFKKDFIVFKVKYMKRARHKGARCDQSHKKDAIQIINDLLGETVVPADSTKSRIELCIVEEFLLRSFQSKAKDGKAWFLNPGEAALVDIEKLSF